MLRKWQSLLDADVALYPLRDVLLKKKKKKVHQEGEKKQENDNKM